MLRQPDIIADVRGFMKSRVILSAAALDFFTRLEGNYISAEELADMLGLNRRATTRILDCLITFNLLEKKNGRYRTTEAGAPLSAKHPQSILPAANHMNTIWDNWSRLTEAVAKGVNLYLKPVVDTWSEENRKAFIGTMHVAAAGLSEIIAGAYDAGRFKRLLDVGGGSGAYTIAFLKKNPHLRAVLFDLAEVVPIAEEKIRQQGLADRVTIVAGDFYKDGLPEGCDLALLSAVIHQNGPAQNVALFRKIHGGLTSGGALLIRDHIMDAARTDPPAGAVFALNMLVNTPGGDTYTFGEVNDMLTRVGFSEVKWIRVGKKMDCLVEAIK